MSNNQECTICTYIDPDKGQDTRHNRHETFYGGNGGQSDDVKICLCRIHSRELFKAGQVRFLIKYWPIACKYEAKGNKSFFKLMKAAIEIKPDARTA